MRIQKARVIIASILLIIVLTFVLRDHISWESLLNSITTHTPRSALPPVFNPQERNTPSAPTESTTTLQADESLRPAPTIAPEIPTVSEIHIIPEPEIILKKSRVARRRRVKQTQQEIPVLAPETSELVVTNQAPLVESTKQAPTRSQQIEDSEQKKISIHNKIDINTLAVKHWTGTYSPTKLEITVNNVPFIIVGTNPTPLEALQEIPYTDNRITVQYAYEFLNGLRKGSDTIVYTVTENAPELALHFSWETAWHVELDGAQRVDMQH